MNEAWPTKKLGELCVFVRGPFGGSLKKECFINDGFAVYEQQHAIYNQFSDIRYFISDGKFKEMKRFELLPGDLIMSCSGTMGKVAIVPNGLKRGIINQALLKLTPKPELNIEYLKYWMGSEDFDLKISEHSKGAAIKNVASVQILKTITLPCPNRLAQQRTVAILDEAFAAIDQAKANVERNLQNAKELFQSELNSVLSNKGEGWVEKKLIEIGKTQTGNTPPTVEPDNYGSYLPFVKPAHFKTDGTIDSEDSGLSEKGLKFARVFSANSILMVCIGATIGKTAFTPIAVTSNQQINALTPNHGYEPRYFYYALTTDDFFNKIIHASSQATLPIINKSKWENLTVAFPTDKKQQVRIVRQLDTLSVETKKLEEKYQQKLSALDDLKKSILEKAFKGELKEKEIPA